MQKFSTPNHGSSQDRLASARPCPTYCSLAMVRQASHTLPLTCLSSLTQHPPHNHCHTHTNPPRPISEPAHAQIIMRWWEKLTLHDWRLFSQVQGCVWSLLSLSSNLQHTHRDKGLLADVIGVDRKNSIYGLLLFVVFLISANKAQQNNLGP